MPISPVSSLTRAATRQDGEPLNILTFVTHERYERNLCKTGHNFYSLTGDGIRSWNTQYAPIPKTYHILPPTTTDVVPLSLDFDAVLCQNVMAHYEMASSICSYLQLPMINLWHILPPIDWDDEQFQFFSNLSGDVDVFISDYNRKKWGRNESNSLVLYHGVDTDFWKPVASSERKQRMMSVVNDWVNRDWCCGYKIWERVARGLPCHVVGDTPGLSQPAESLEALRLDYSESQIFVNTSTHSPVPCSLLEAMACECAVVSTATCLIPEIIENGVNGFCTNDEDELKKYMTELLNDAELCKKLGKAARKTIEEMFGMDRFVSEWNNVIWGVVDA